MNLEQEDLSPNPHTLSVSVGDKEIIFETGKIARHASGAATVRCGDTILLSTVCIGPVLEGGDFLPLRVDYQEKFSAAGKTLGGFIKREGKPTEKEVLISRLIDRPIRPLFPEGYFYDTQIISTVFSYDGVHLPDPLAICASSAALLLSNAPLAKPIGGVRIGFVDGRFVVNPTYQEMQRSTLDLVLAGTEEAILMIEGYCDFLSEEQVMEAVAVGHTSIKKICHALADWPALLGKEKKVLDLYHFSPTLLGEVEELMREPLQQAIRLSKKQEQKEALASLRQKVEDKIRTADSPYSSFEVARAMKKVTAKYMREMILSEKRRSDGRALDEVRPIYIEMAPLPRTHGSVLFTRGETQALAVCTLGGASMGQRYETLDLSEGLHNFYLQYSFPPYCVGEVARMGAPGRRELGHGKLAERSLSAIIPNQSRFPYTIRVESNITESNGSSSMASVCGGCLALMDAGVPVERPIAGIAMGLIIEEEDHAILSDILGIEDALGDMDFKIAGNQQGITAFQLDIKVEGITPALMRKALAQAKAGRIHILEEMLKACPQSRRELSLYAPRIEKVKIKTSQIGAIIGTGGKQIRAITEETGVQVDVDDSGVVSLASTSLEAMEKAKKIIQDLTTEVEVGKVYDAKIVSLKDFGLFVSFLNVQALCHVSELNQRHPDPLDGSYKEGDAIQVRVVAIDKMGKIRVSQRQVDHPESASPEENRRSFSHTGPRRDREEGQEGRRYSSHGYNKSGRDGGGHEGNRRYSSHSTRPERGEKERRGGGGGGHSYSKPYRERE